ncbi:hypothetical protein Tco_0064147 [Tanacetum coccineum]
MMHSISPCRIFITAMCAYSFTMHHRTSCVPFILHASCMVSYKDYLYKLLLVQVMAASNIPVSAEENLGDPIDIRVDIIHPEPVAAVAFPAAAIVRTQAQHGEAIRGIQEHLLGVPIQVVLTALRFREDIAEAGKQNASPWRARTYVLQRQSRRLLVNVRDRLVLRLSSSWLRFKSPSVRTERTLGNSRSS